MKRKGDAASPLNLTYGLIGSEDDALADLRISGFVSEHNYHFIGFEPAYRDVFGVDLRRAEVMAETPRRIYRRLQKDRAYEPCDVFVSFCAAIGAKWAVTEVEHHGRWLSDSRWR